MKASKFIEILRGEVFSLLNNYYEGDRSFNHRIAGHLFDMAVTQTKNIIRVDGQGCDKCIRNLYPGKIILTKKDSAGHWICEKCGRRLT